MTKHNKERKEYILQIAYCLLFKDNVEKITIADLESKLKLTRGAIFYYFPNKSELFKAALNAYFFPTLYQFHNAFTNLEEYRNPYERIIDSIHELDKSVNSVKAFINILLQADKFYPNFSILLRRRIKMEKKWLYNELNVVDTSDMKKYIDSIWIYKLGILLSEMIEQ